MKRTVLASCLLVGLSLTGALPSALSLTGQWGVIFAVDTPWRLEPLRLGQGLTYGSIPIVISFRQASNEKDREYGITMRRIIQDAGNPLWVGQITSVEVTEVTQAGISLDMMTRILPAQFREIESKRLLSTKDTEPIHKLCHPYLGQDCSMSISDTDEWHGMFWYTPRAEVKPGRNIHLQVLVSTVSGSDRHSWLSFLVVHAGDAPLPRFSDSWLYGDLHYHSQMTGNEGEYGHSYRNVARVLGSLGMDFVFATDHASNGEQTLGRVTTGRCGNSAGSRCVVTNVEGEFPCDGGKQCQIYSAVAARDLNAARFGEAKRILYGREGANEAVARDEKFGMGRLRSAHILPQVYMGEEVDAMPEMSSQEYREGSIKFGDGLKYPWPDVNNCLTEHASTSQASCFDIYSMTYAERDHRSYLVRDSQGASGEEHVGEYVWDKTKMDILAGAAKIIYGGLMELVPDLKTALTPVIAPARQHLLYFPSNNQPSTSGWVSSDTGKFGGATKRLSEVIGEIDINKGFTFLAHPLHNARPGGFGPDVVPYSDRALDRAWSSKAVLGLEFWNEHHSRAAELEKGEQDFGGMALMAPFQHTKVKSFPWAWPKYVPLSQGLYLYDGAYTWDRYLRKGLDQGETAAIPWLAKGEPRKWFMASGSDAHGDFNYRQTGNLCTHRWCTDSIIDTAIGRPRNLVFVPQPPAGATIPDLPTAKRYTNAQVLQSLQAGLFSSTNGPAIRMVIDKNRNGKIDATDFQMGSTFDLYPGEQIPLLVEWKSSPEFGPVAQVDVYLGTPVGTFAPRNHGPVIPTQPHYSNAPSDRNPDYGNYQPDLSGALQVRLIADTAAVGFHGIARVLLSPEQFGLSGVDKGLFYIRTFAKTRDGRAAAARGECPTPETAGNSCGDGLAYSNPIWGRYRAACPTRRPNPNHGLKPATFLDADNNRFPDVCERKIPNPCPRHGDIPDAGNLEESLKDRPSATDLPQTGGSCTVVYAANKFDQLDPVIHTDGEIKEETR